VADAITTENSAAVVQPQGQPAAQVQAPAYTLPEKFKGKSVEDVARAYSELEKTHGEVSSRVGAYDKYAKLGSPEQVEQALQWAADVAGKLQRGELTPAQAQAQLNQNAATQNPYESFDKWDELDGRSRADALNKLVTDAVKQAAKPYEDRLTQFQTNEQRQLGLLTQVFELAQKNPSISMNELLQKANSLASQKPEDLLNMALQSMVAPQQQEALKAQMRAEILAEQNQAAENARISALNGASSLQLGIPDGKKLTRNETLTNILNTLKERGVSTQGIPLT
jgi:hypothetical protein